MNNRLLVSAILLKSLLLVVVVPHFQSDLFIPFLRTFELNKDPWQSWISSGGSVEAFPYGLVMLGIFIPVKIGSLFSILLGLDSTASIQMTFSIIILAFDISISAILRKTNSSVPLQVTFAFSPLVIWVNYILGQTDLIPAMFLLLMAHFLMKSKSNLAGVMFGMAIGAKFSILLAVPFLFVYFYDNPRYTELFRKFSVAACLTTFFNYSPILFSKSFRKMVFGTPEISHLQDFRVDLGSVQVIIFPVIYVLLLYWLWRIGRTSLQVLSIFISSALLALSIISSSSIGWTVWGIPLLCLVVEEIRLETVIGLNFLFVSILISHLTTNTRIAQNRFGNEIELHLLTKFHNITSSLAITLAVIVLGSILRKGIAEGDYYKISKKPLIISIAGDSGVGKDTLTNILKSAFGPNGTIVIPGDSYHKYERNDSTWRVVTHLNPDANKLNIWATHLKLAIMRRKFYYSEYNHENGRFFKKKIDQNGDLIISQGLHALYEQVGKDSDLGIYLSMESQLKSKLKISRDTTMRQQDLKTLTRIQAKRQIDFEKYIDLQSLRAHLQIHFAPGFGEHSSDFQIFFRSQSKRNIQDLASNLVALTGVQIRSVQIEGTEWYTISPEHYYRLNLDTLVKSSIEKYKQLFPTATSSITGLNALLSYLVFYSLAKNREENYE